MALPQLAVTWSFTIKTVGTQGCQSRGTENSVPYLNLNWVTKNASRVSCSVVLKTYYNTWTRLNGPVALSGNAQFSDVYIIDPILGCKPGAKSGWNGILTAYIDFTVTGPGGTITNSRQISIPAVSTGKK
jgi:hypothetical protein